MSSIFFIIANELNLYKQVNQDQFTFSDNSTNSGAITTEFNNKDEGFQSRIDESQDIGECEEIYNVEEYLNNEIPFFLNLEQNHNPFQIGWLESQVLLQQGLLYNNFLLYKESIIILTEAIKLNPLNIDAYIERAFAYFETNQLSLALIDYEEAKKLKPVFGEVIAKGLYSPENKIEFSKGLISGVIEGSKISKVGNLLLTNKSE